MLHMERVRKLSAFKEQAECMRQAVELVEQGMAAMTRQARHILSIRTHSCLALSMYKSTYHSR